MGPRTHHLPRSWKHESSGRHLEFPTDLGKSPKMSTPCLEELVFSQGKEESFPERETCDYRCAYEDGKPGQE